MQIKVHPNACKHISEEQVRQAWGSVAKYIQRESRDEPPRWPAIGWLPNGADVELVAVELIDAWLVIHANSPVRTKFYREIERTERRAQ